MWFATAATIQYCAVRYRLTLLSKMTPEQRRAFYAKEAEARLDCAPEVQFAREFVDTLDLRGEHAERLLTFARDLARRRIN